MDYRDVPLWASGEISIDLRAGAPALVRARGMHASRTEHQSGTGRLIRQLVAGRRTPIGWILNTTAMYYVGDARRVGEDKQDDLRESRTLARGHRDKTSDRSTTADAVPPGARTRT